MCPWLMIAQEKQPLHSGLTKERSNFLIKDLFCVYKVLLHIYILYICMLNILQFLFLF